MNADLMAYAQQALFDPDTPPERVAALCAETEAAVLLTTRDAVAQEAEHRREGESGLALEPIRQLRDSLGDREAVHEHVVRDLDLRRSTLTLKLSVATVVL